MRGGQREREGGKKGGRGRKKERIHSGPASGCSGRSWTSPDMPDMN